MSSGDQPTLFFRRLVYTVHLNRLPASIIHTCVLLNYKLRACSRQTSSGSSYTFFLHDHEHLSASSIHDSMCACANVLQVLLVLAEK